MGTIGQDPSVFTSKQLHVDILWYFYIKSGVFYKVV